MLEISLLGIVTSNLPPNAPPLATPAKQVSSLRWAAVAPGAGLEWGSVQSHAQNRLRRLFNIACLFIGPLWLGADSAVWLLGLLIVASIALLKDTMVAVPLAASSSLAALGGMRKQKQVL